MEVTPILGLVFMIAHGGGVTVFPGPNTSAVPKYRGPYDANTKQVLASPQFYATLTGNDARAVFREPPQLRTLGVVQRRAAGQSVLQSPPKLSAQTDGRVITERGPFPNDEHRRLVADAGCVYFRFEFEDGTPTKFWAVLFVNHSVDEPLFDQWALTLAKYVVNPL